MGQLQRHNPNETKSLGASSPNDTPVSSLQIADAFVGASLASIVREHGRGEAVMFITRELDMVNRVCGNTMEAETLSFCAELVLDRFKFRTVNALRIALRDGMNSGKIYGKLTYPLLAEWMNDHEAKVEEFSYRKHMSSK